MNLPSTAHPLVTRCSLVPTLCVPLVPTLCVGTRFTLGPKLQLGTALPGSSASAAPEFGSCLHIGRSRSRSQSPTEGFTLVELLTVIVIIGILASLITAAAITARTAALNGVVVSEVSQLDQNLQTYKDEIGQLPPDFSDPGAVINHLRLRFPHYKCTGWAQFQTDVQTGCGLNVNDIGRAEALVFWLGGVPDSNTVSTIPAGFSANAGNPFQPGKPRTKQYFQFDRDQFGNPSGSGWRAYYPPGIEAAPYVFFRARNSNYAGLSYAPADNANAGTAVPYRNGANTAWRNEKTFQIITAGLDGVYGTGTGARCSQTGTGCTAADYDNHTNFTQGKIQDEM